MIENQTKNGKRKDKFSRFGCPRKAKVERKCSILGKLFSSVSEVEEAGEGELPLAALLLHLGLIIL